MEVRCCTIEDCGSLAVAAKHIHGRDAAEITEQARFISGAGYQMKRRRQRSCRFPDFIGGGLYSNGDNSDIAAFGGSEPRECFAAWRAPGRPELDQNNLSGERG